MKTYTNNDGDRADISDRSMRHAAMLDEAGVEGGTGTFAAALAVSVSLIVGGGIWLFTVAYELLF